jgi:hypothetical protein
LGLFSIIYMSKFYGYRQLKTSRFGKPPQSNMVALAYVVKFGTPLSLTLTFNTYLSVVGALILIADALETDMLPVLLILYAVL